ncbi:adhesion G-protein coupled receptor G1 [Bombina bombina]|uniref:adhesion G-protein coupled receptor G1 n=1 Tax=Bombina bombina TaxID=8345 RepID=UPI00235AA383|nr:adhesion G-protein coupled receptor G1 [Bombina bombina]XP_053558672.1 adhesion G-protein coupled receptor G1 [Bombina bombina]XP_053558680.1 adhesion G-protein coupled receptor G1 [Bombina bombina]XP_053558688.1 adhesion G-protein coupled receptor G1 [Bombina bombina]
MSHCLILPLLLLLQGFTPWTHGFTLCGWRNQFSGGGILQYEGNSSHDDSITVENRLDGLIVQSALLPSKNITLKDLHGPYVFCVRWFPSLKTFMLTYGLQNYTWRVSHRSSATNQTTRVVQEEKCPINTSFINLTVNGYPINSSCRFHFKPEEWSNDAKFVGREIAEVGRYLRDVPVDAKKAQSLRKWIDNTLSQVQFEGHSRHFGNSLIRASVFKVESADMLNSIPQETGISVSLPKELVQSKSSSQPTRLHVVRIHNLSLFQDADNSSVLSNQIIGISVENRKIVNLTENIVFTFQHRPVEENFTSVCVFWNESGSAWSTDGCKTEAGKHTTKCKCNHLTYFAVLMQVSSQTISEDHLVALSAITFAGCSISALAALFTVTWYLCSRKIQSNPTLQIHMNLLGALFLLDMFFMCSAVLGALQMPALCQGSAILLHSAQLCTFTWMAIEGFNLYRLVVKVFNSSSISVRKLVLLGWVAPLLIVVVIALVDYSNYGMYNVAVNRTSSNVTASLCWLTNPVIHQVLNLGMFATVLLFNFVMLVAMTRRVLRLSPHTRKEQVRHCVTLLGLSCMLGLPWVIGFFSWGELFLPVQYVFSILNSLQGFFIFIWYWALSLPHSKNPSRSCDSTSGTPSSPKPEQNSNISDQKKLLTLES